MNNEIFPKSFRYLIWAICVAIVALIGLTGYIAISVQQMEQEVYQLRQTMGK